MENKCTLYTGPYDEATRIVAEKELRETPEVVAESLAELKRLLAEATDLYFDNSDESLLVFLRPSHFYPESALKLVCQILLFIYFSYSFQIV